MFDKIMNGRAVLCRAALLSAIGLVPIVTMTACGDAGNGAGGDEAVTGSVGLAITSPDGELIRSVKYTITNAAGEVVKNDVVNVSDDKSTISVAFSLPAGTGYTIKMTAATAQGGSCTGSAKFDVVKSSTTRVDLSLACQAGGKGTGDVLVNGTLERSCPRVASETAAPLATSVGGTIALSGAASSKDGVLTWSATSGKIASPNAANTTFTCTTAGTAKVTLTATRGTACSDSKQIDVACVAPLPKNLVLTDCQKTRVCQLEQHGTDWKAVCDAGATVLTGTIQGATAAWNAPSGLPCTATLQDGQLIGSCQTASGTCAASSKEPLASATCLTVPSQLLVDGCGSAGSRCDVVQNACTWQASCQDGKVFGGTTTASQLRWTAADGSSCRSAASDGTLPAGALSGTCTPPRTNPTGIVACNFTTQRPSDLPPDPVCQPLASSFVLSGCGFGEQYGENTGDAIVRTIQNGCLWQVSGADELVLNGRAVDATYSWVTSDAKKCSGSLVQGKLSGSCSVGTETCQFAQRDPLPPPADYPVVPPSITIDGCGVSGSCKTVQDGNDWQAVCNDSVVYNGVVTQTGLALLTHIDDAPYWCTLDIANSAISGSCKPYPLTEGSESVCSITGAAVSSTN